MRCSECHGTGHIESPQGGDGWACAECRGSGSTIAPGASVLYRPVTTPKRRRGVFVRLRDDGLAEITDQRKGWTVLAEWDGVKEVKR